MAHHHQGRYDQVHGTQDARAISCLPSSARVAAMAEDEPTAEADEPPDDDVLQEASTHRSGDTADPHGEFTRIYPVHRDRKWSLLSQALAPSSEAITAVDTQTHRTTARLGRESSNASSTGYMSAASTTDLTSDGGLTSPARTNTPSPPPPRANYQVNMEPATKLPTTLNLLGHEGREDVAHISTEHAIINKARDPTSDAAPERKRCVKFACKGAAPTPASDAPKAMARDSGANDTKTEEPPKRACALRFACPFKAAGEAKLPPPSSKARRAASPAVTAMRGSPRRTLARPVDGARISKPSPSPRHEVSSDETSAGPTDGRVSKSGRVEATRFHEFASSVEEDEDWMHDETIHKHRLTVEDTLTKEKTIRQIGEEAEAEAQQEDEETQEGGDPDDEDEEDDPGNSDDEGEEVEDEAFSDDGHRSDDEGGFASSDDDADDDSTFSFWTVRRSTAATSVEHLDQSPHTTRPAALSSPVDFNPDIRPAQTSAIAIPPKPLHLRRAVKMCPGTPTLPDSTDFVCGTLDEDRPMEEAYASCLEQRKRSSHQTIPQDIDPSFPTSDLEDDDNDEDVDDDDDHNARDDRVPARGKSDRNHHTQTTGKEAIAGRKMNQPLSPTRLHSPPPPRRARLGRSPPPPRAIETSPRRRRSPAPGPQKSSRTSSGQSSAAVSPKGQHHMHIFQTARPQLTRTKSLPRAPNPYYQHVTKAICQVDGALDEGKGSRTTSPVRHRPRKAVHRRGAIDIVSGLEKKRQRRREKAWLKYCQRAAKGKERKPAPGQGAERMRELGLVMAGKNKPHGGGAPLAQYILSF